MPVRWEKEVKQIEWLNQIHATIRHFLLLHTHLSYSKYLNRAFDFVVLRLHPYRQSFGKLGTFRAIQAMGKCSFHDICAMENEENTFQ